MKKINLRISELRHKKRKITQQELADVVGVSFQTISKWEKWQCNAGYYIFTYAC